MGFIRAALRRPITVLVAMLAVALTAVFGVSRMRVDIFPDLNLPVIYVAQPYGGMSPAQMEGYLTYYYEYHFLYINGIESVESKSIQNTGLLKLTFHPGTDMAEAMAQTIGYVNRARAFMPPGTVGPFIMRFDAGTVPVGYLVFSSETRNLGESQDLALNRVRPQFATLPGLTSPPPKQIQIEDPDGNPIELFEPKSLSCSDLPTTRRRQGLVRWARRSDRDTSRSGQSRRNSARDVCEISETCRQYVRMISSRDGARI